MSSDKKTKILYFSNSTKNEYAVCSSHLFAQIEDRLLVLPKFVKELQILSNLIKLQSLSIFPPRVSAQNWHLNWIPEVL